MLNQKWIPLTIPSFADASLQHTRVEIQINLLWTENQTVRSSGEPFCPFYSLPLPARVLYFISSSNEKGFT